MLRTCGAVLVILGLVIAAPGADQSNKGKAVTPFNGKDLTGWKFKGSEAKSKWVVGTAVMDEKSPSKLLLVPSLTPAPTAGSAQLVNTQSSVDIYTEEKFGDCLIELDFMIPKGSNSGVYVMGEYEVQIYDTFGKTKIEKGDMGAIYQIAAPKVNACRKPGEWQKYVIDFQAPRFEGGKKVANAKFLKVIFNDQVIHDNVEAPHVTPSGITGKEAPRGPLMFQGDHGPVAFRNIKITPKDAK
jgi:hypothetical protein